jgi:signal transduction histidine kinase
MRAPGTGFDERTQGLIEAGMTIASGLELDAALERLLELARRLTDARYAAVGVLDPAGAYIERFVTSGVTEEERRRIGPPPLGRGLLGVLITDAHPLRIDDIATNARASGFPPNHPPMHTFLGVPVLAGREVFGNLYLTEKQGGVFTEDDERLAVTLAAQAGVAVQNARLYEQATAQARRLDEALAELSSVQDITEAIAMGRPAEEVLQLIVDGARASAGCRFAAVALAAEDGTVLRFVAVSGDADELPTGRLETGSSALGAAFRARRSVVVEDMSAEPGAGAAGRDADAQLIVPLVHRNQALGVLVAAVDAEGFASPDRRLLEGYATRAVLAIEMHRVISGERERADAEAKLATADMREAARQETLRRVVEAQEAERRRIARELHDETGQALVSVLMGLRLVDQQTEGAGEAIGELRETVSNAIQELRALAVELRPTALDDFGLGPALERLGDTFARRTGIRVELDVSRLDDGRLGERTETALYRIVQEGLTNVAKHAGAASASVVVGRSGDAVRLVVEDDGHGFDPAAADGGLGLVSMRERAELVGGKLEVESSAAGTTVTAVVPVPTG